MTDMLNKSDYEGYEEAMAYFEELEEEENALNDNSEHISLEDDKSLHRKHRKNARKAKKHQLELSNSVKRKRRSPYRWNPVWHKMKLSDVSPQKIKARLEKKSEKDAIKEIINI